jgi:hypothetical protein
MFFPAVGYEARKRNQEQQIADFLLRSLSGGVHQQTGIQNMTNFITDPSGVQWLATSDMGYYWAGFGIGMMFFGFGLVFRLVRRVGGTTSDF